MVYEIAHFIQNRLGFLWTGVESVNSWLFSIRYRKNLKQIPNILKENSTRFNLVLPTTHDVEPLVTFFENQPEDAYEYFRPHQFDKKTINKLVKRKSFVMFLVKDEEKIVGYAFIRSFFHGKGFLGKMVDVSSQGQGVGKLICSVAMQICASLPIRMFETISKDNIASLKTSQNACDVTIVRELDHGYLYIEDKLKR